MNWITIEQWLLARPTILVFVGLWLWGTIATLIILWHEDRRNFKGLEIIKIVSVSVAYFLALFVLWLSGRAAFSWVTANPEVFAPILTWPYVAIPALAFSFGCFWLRCRFPLVYGLLEIGAGFLTTYTSTQEKIGSVPLRLFALLAGIYIFVRGLDNVDKALKKWSPRWAKTFWGPVYWTDSVKEVLDLLGGDRAHQQRVLSGDLAGVRSALKGSRFEKLEQHELESIIFTAVFSLRRRDVTG